MYRTEINHIINYKEDDQTLSYKAYKIVESTHIETFNKEKEEFINLYKELNKSIYASLNDTASNYINIDNTIIIKKSDFVNVALEIRNH
jgi:hypothetical protein